MAKDSEKGNSKRLSMIKQYGLNPKKLYSDLSIPVLVEFSIQKKRLFYLVLDHYQFKLVNLLEDHLMIDT
jgi:hypothetical protein